MGKMAPAAVAAVSTPPAGIGRREDKRTDKQTAKRGLRIQQQRGEAPELAPPAEQ